MSWDMNNMFNPMGNAPVQPNNYFNRPLSLPKYNIIRVAGENGARSMQMSPNSEVLALDNTAPIVWLLQTDGAGYLSATPFDISAHQVTPPIDVSTLEQRISKLEEMLNAKSNSKSNE